MVSIAGKTEGRVMLNQEQPSARASSASSFGQAGGEILTADHFRIVARVTQSVCRRHRLKASDAEEFAAVVNLRLLEDNYRAIRQFQGRSSLSTYLTVVIQRFYLDFLIGQRGKWRPSAKAKRLGRVAILLERLTRRDGWTFAEAVACLQTNYGVEATWEELYDLSTTLPHGHLRRHTMPEHHAWQVASPDPEPDVRILHAEQRVKARRTRSALKHAVTALTGEERVLLRLRFCQGLSVAKMARMLNVDQRKLYGIFDRLFHRLRLSLEAGGVSASDVEPPAVT